ncbi:MAG: amino acid adenylation domain-containing protein [Acidobacteriota bacterium]
MTRSLKYLFESSARIRPDGSALRFGSETLSYSELDGRANRLASYLRELGVGSDVLVGVCLERGIDLPLAVLSVIKAGGAYVPLDPTYPRERLALMLADTTPRVVITTSALAGTIPSGSCTVIRIDSDSRKWADKPAGPLDGDAGAEDLAYVIFTSGSTGTPKGVAMPQRPLVNLIEWQIEASKAGAGDRTIQFAPLSFDVSFQEIWSTWASGGELVMVQDEVRLDAGALLSLCDELSVMRLFLPFTALQHIAEVATTRGPLPQSLREVITAGEQLQTTPAIREMFRGIPGCRLTNQYGPSETHVTTAFDLPPDPATWDPLPPIGTPLPGVVVHILDAEQHTVAEGESGELFLGGLAPARSYVGRPELTAERFITEPDASSPRIAGAPGTMYRTGDLVRRRSDGALEFLGRADSQVKVRGYRIEVGEVEVALSGHPAVGQTVVAAHEFSPGDRRLIAWVIPATGAEPPGPSMLRQHLSERLPEYMIPSAFTVMDSFPLTPSGKVDRLALPLPGNSRPDIDAQYEPPRGPVEPIVAAVWREILQLDRVGAGDSFFELGGTSLLALRAISELRQRLRRELSVVSIFDHSTPRGMAQYLSGRSPSVDQSARSRGERVRAGQARGDVAIVGLAGRFPGAPDVASLWRNLLSGVDSITHFREDEIDPRIDASDPNYVKARGVVADADMFDNVFFGENRRVAEVIDPQQRVLLEVAWAALEDAGVVPESFEGSIGVFAGVGNNSYYPMNVATRPDVIRSVGEFQVMTGNEKDYPATRIAHKLGLTGPALSIQTACSTSLVAVVEAVRSLLAGECDAALAGGSSITVPQNSGHLYLEGGMLSPDGACRPFAADAAGTVFSDGAAVVVLKRVEDALTDGDRIYAVIRGAAINNDGAGKASFTAPSVAGQAAVIAMAQASANVDPDTITLVEAHGTATPLGDPIEVEALSAAFRAKTSRNAYCAIGSIKGNIGHLTAAAGVAGLIKASLSLHNEEIPPSINCRETNANIDFSRTPFFVNTERLAWERSERPRRAAVSSFGVGGTNAHVILEEAPATPETAQVSARPKHLFLLSAKSAASLEGATENLRQYIAEVAPDSSGLGDICHTLQARRARFSHRRFLVADDAADAATALQDLPGERSGTRTLEIQNPEVAFLFPGQGSQYAGMGRSIYEIEPVFRSAVDECATILQPLMGRDLRALMFPPPGDAEAAADALTQTSITQPALFTIGYALARQWESWGVRPSAMLGHSIGELVAACLADVLSLNDALTLVAVRGRMMQSVAPGSMLSVRASAREIESLLVTHGDHSIAMAASNGPSLCVVSGPTESIAHFEQTLTARGTISRPLHTSHAFHSPMMDSVVEPFREVVQELTLRSPTVPIVSTVTGTWMTGEQARDPNYWASQVRLPVRFAEAVSTLWQDRARVLLEMGPRGTAATMARQQARDRNQVAVASLGESGADEWTAMLAAVGKLWNAGVEIDAAAFWDGRRQVVSLPAYSFERIRHWVEPGQLVLPAPSGNAPEVASIAADESRHLPRFDRILARVVSIIEDASGVAIPAADSRTTFLEMGLDSLFLTQIALTLGRDLGVQVSFRQLLQTWPTPHSLARHIDEVLAPGTFAGDKLPGSPPAEPSPESLQPPLADSQPAPDEKSKKHVGPMARIDRTAAAELSPRQKESLANFVALYCRKMAKSKEFTAHNRHHLADPRVVSGFSPLRKEITFPIVCDRSKGSKLWDLDGNEYVDLTNGFGAAFFGHTPDLIVDAVREQMQRGIEIGPQHPMIAEVSTLFCAMTGNERVAWCNTGSEAVLGAMRAARTVTGRNTIAIFEGGYHGIFDEVIVRGTKSLRSIPAAPGIPPSHVQNILVLEYGTPQTLRILEERAGELAAIMIETVQSRRPGFQPGPFLHACRTIADDSGAALIFDEVITGFRIRAGGAQEYFGVKADLATYGKILGGGMPIGAVGGTRRFMDAFDGGEWQFGDDSAPEAGVTYFAGTFVRHPPALAAARAALTFLSRHPEIYEEVSSRTAGFADRVNAAMMQLGAPVRLDRFGSLLKIRIDEELPHAGLFYHWLRSKGVHAWEGRPCFLTMAHDDRDVDFLVQAFEDSAREMQQADLLPRRGGMALGERAAPATEAQREIWASIQMGGDETGQGASLAYNETCAIRLKGPLDVSRLRVAFAAVVMRHESLRSRFSVDGRTFYVNDNDVNAEVPLEDLSSLSQSERNQKLGEIAREEALLAFDLERGPVWRARLTRVAADEHLFWFTAHHIVCDGWSTAVVLHDLGRLYSGADPGKAESFVDYALWQRTPQQREAVERDLSFWRERLGEHVPQLDLPTDRIRPPLRTYAAGRVDHEIAQELVATMKRVGAASGASFVATMLAGFTAFLSRIAVTRDFVIGVPTAGQSVIGQDLLLGHAVNVLPLRVEVDQEGSFASHLAHVQRLLLDAYDHQHLSFGELIQNLDLPRDPSRIPLVPVVFNVDTGIDDFSLEGLQSTFISNPREFDTFELFINASSANGQLVIEAQYNRALFDRGTIERHLLAFQRMLAAAVADPDQRIGELALLGNAERDRILIDFNSSRPAEALDGETLMSIFEKTADRTPDAIAVVSETRSLTYKELDAASNQLAHVLRRRGAGPERTVGICLERSIDLVIAVYAVLKTGAAFIPLEPDNPTERIAHMLEDSQPVVVIADSFREEELGLAAPVVNLTTSAAEISSAPVGRLPLAVIPSSLAYIIFTSGSTGRPKGVMNEHRGVLNFLKWFHGSFSTGEAECIALKTPFGFDVSVPELCAPLFGVRLAILEPGAHRDPMRIAQATEEFSITTLQFVPSMLHLFVADPESRSENKLRSLRRIIAGGEALPSELAMKVREALPDVALFNVYGPTEAAVWASAHRCDVSPDTTSVPIGRPISNTRFYIVDGNLQPTPIGVPGELLIGGIQVARGYVGHPELTAERFIQDPFGADLPSSPGMLYRTGDLARWLPDGEVEFLGRNDYQVKLRGVRIELPEIEAAIAALPEIERCVATVRRIGTADDRLVAYVVPVEGNSVTAGGLRKRLRASLPDSMIPQHVVNLRELPLNLSGKLDRNALPAPAEFEALDGREELVTPTERLVGELWKALLSLSRVGRGDNFFDLGGHSLKALEAVAALRASTGIRLDPRLLMLGSLSQIASEIDSASGQSALPDETRSHLNDGQQELEDPSEFAISQPDSDASPEKRHTRLSLYEVIKGRILG